LIAPARLFQLEKLKRPRTAICCRRGDILETLVASAKRKGKAIHQLSP
jgi:hypothetical protein